MSTVFIHHYHGYRVLNESKMRFWSWKLLNLYYTDPIVIILTNGQTVYDQAMVYAKYVRQKAYPFKENMANWRQQPALSLPSAPSVFEWPLQDDCAFTFHDETISLTLVDFYFYVYILVYVTDILLNLSLKILNSSPCVLSLMCI